MTRKARAKSSSPESQDSNDQQMSRPNDKTINTFLQGLEDFSPRMGDRIRQAIERCLDGTPSPGYAADHYFREDYEDEEGYVPEWNLHMDPSANEADEYPIASVAAATANSRLISLA